MSWSRRCGTEAVEKFTQHQTDLDIVFMDCHMPGMDGFEATRQIRALNPTVPIIALTADVLEDAHNACFAAGMNYVLTKPVSIAEIDSALTRHLTDPP